MGGVVDAFSDAIHSFGESTGVNDVVDDVWNGLQDLGTDISDAIGVKGFFDELIPKPNIPDVDYSKVRTASSPTYNSQIRQNSARLGQAVPEIFGTAVIFPDLVSKTADWYSGPNRKSNHLLTLGMSPLQNEVVINEIKIGGAALSEVQANYQEFTGKFTKQLSAVSGSSDITNSAPAKLVSLPGASAVELVKDADNDGVYGFYEFASIADAGQIYINLLFRNGLFDIDANGNRVGASCSFSITVEVNGIATTTSHTLTNSSPEKDEFFGLITINKIITSSDSVRLKITRTTANKTTGGVNACNIGQIFVYDNVETGMDDVKLVAVQTLAKAELSKDTDRKISIKATRTGISTTRQAVEYVWAQAGIDMALLDASPLDSATYTSINGIFDTRGSVFETVKKIARLSRAYPVWENNGKLTFYVDVPRSSVMTIDDDMLVLDTLKVNLSCKQEFDNDGIKVRYHDPETMIEKFAVYPASAVNPRQEDLLGCTDSVQAQSEAEFIYKNMIYRNKEYSFKTELDPNDLKVGDIVRLYSFELEVDDLIVLTSISPSGKFTLNINAKRYDERVYV